MIWIGLTGGIASGKSAVSNYLKTLGYPVADADEYAHQALSRGTESYKAVLQHFGPEILGVDGVQIDRRALGKKVFQNETELRFLEQCIHPYVQKKVQENRKQWEKEGFAFAFYDVPLLFEKKLESQFDFILLVAADESVRRMRMRQRNSWSDEEISDRLKSQLDMELKKRQSHFVIENNGTFSELEDKVEQMLKHLADLEQVRKS